MPTWNSVASHSGPRPPRTITLEQSAFNPTWHLRPTTAVSLGIRPIALLDVIQARSAAAAAALALHPADNDPAAVDAFKDELVAWVVSRCTCDPDDVGLEAAIWDGMPQDNVKAGLTPAAVLAIFDAYERLTIEQDPSQTEATDDEIVRLPDVYAEAAMRLQGERLSRVRRLLGFVLDELKAAIDE